jgi:AraC family transcriptional regulator
MTNAGIGAVLNPGGRLPREWVDRVKTLLDAAIGELTLEGRAAHSSLLQAAMLLREQIDPQAARAAADGAGRLLAWQARKVRDYIDAHIKGPIRVADLSALIHRSEAHFSRAFKRTFGVSPHAFLIQCRLELAAQLMLDTGLCLSDVALRCGFADQAHLCKHFRHSTGQTPAAWRRARRTQDLGSGAASLAGKARARGEADVAMGTLVSSRGSRSPLHERQPERACGSRV